MWECWRVLAGMGVPEDVLAFVGADVDTVAAEFGAEMRESPAKLVVEIQFMTKEYYAMRKKTHAWYIVHGRAVGPRVRHGNRLHGWALGWLGG